MNNRSPLDIETEIVDRINVLKMSRKAVILAHHYQSESVKRVADYVGDSLELARIAANCEADKLILCGVYFMAETAKILSPEKNVYLPNLNAGCPMADMITAERLREEKAKYPDAVVVCYVNSSAEVKAESDICCTSSNAVRIVDSIDCDEILFVPDQNLGHYVSKIVKSKTIHLWRGFCPTHHRVLEADVEAIKKRYPKSELLVHPECQPAIVASADFVGSTSQMIQRAESSESEVLIIGTEESISIALQKRFPKKTIVPLTDAFVCPNMKKTTLDDVLKTLETGCNEVEVDNAVRERAFNAIQAMLDASK